MGLDRKTLSNRVKGRGIKMVTMHPHPLPTGRQAALSPAFAEAASRRQASRERGSWIESMFIFGGRLRIDRIFITVIG
jgi:hypothetical protein